MGKTSSPTSAEGVEAPSSHPVSNQEIQQLAGDHPGSLTYDSSNAAEFEDGRGEIISDEYIRLVRIFTPDTEHQELRQTELRLEFTQVRLAEAPDYNALSYTWGPPSLDPLANIKGYRLTPNLMACLAEAMVTVPGLWWIDALCIDQDNLDEKSQQVKKMRDIYARAEKVYVWLGPEESDGRAALHILCKIFNHVSHGDLDIAGLPPAFEDDQLRRLGLPIPEVLTGGTSDSASLPSWVPNFGERFYNPSHAFQYQETPRKSFSGQWTSKSNVLRVQASTLDEVDIVSSDIGATYTDIDTITMSWLSLAAKAANADAWQWLSSAVDHQNPTSQPFDAFWRTLIGNRWFDEDESLQRGAPDHYLYLFLGGLLPYLLLEDEPRAMKLIDSWSSNIEVMSLIIEPWEQGKTLALRRVLFESSIYKTIFITKAGRMGLGPCTLQSGDSIATFAGGNSLYFVRRDLSSHRFVGHGYVHGLMGDDEHRVETPYVAMNLE
ncbi:MAG: hypothetical protein Q9226_007560 [Calogaya cf. arnoldii]